MRTFDFFFESCHVISLAIFSNFCLVLFVLLFLLFARVRLIFLKDKRMFVYTEPAYW